MGLILNGDKYEWVEDELLELDGIDAADRTALAVPTFEERMEAVEGAVMELAEVVTGG